MMPDGCSEGLEERRPIDHFDSRDFRRAECALDWVI